MLKKHEENKAETRSPSISASLLFYFKRWSKRDIPVILQYVETRLETHLYLGFEGLNV